MNDHVDAAMGDDIQRYTRQVIIQIVSTSSSVVIKGNVL